MRRIPESRRVKRVVLVFAALATTIGAGLIYWFSHSREEGVQGIYDKAYDVGTLSHRRRVLECRETRYHPVIVSLLGDEYAQSSHIWKCTAAIEDDGRETFCWRFESKDSLGAWEPLIEVDITSPRGSGCSSAAAFEMNRAIVNSEFR